MKVSNVILAIALASSGGHAAWAAENPGQVLITVDGVKYTVYAQEINIGSGSVEDAALADQLRATPWWVNSGDAYAQGTFELAQKIANAYYDATSGYAPNDDAFNPGSPVGPYVAYFYDPDFNGGYYFTRFTSVYLGNLVERNQQAAFSDGPYYFLLYSLPSGPSALDTRLSFSPNAVALQGTFAMQSAKMSRGLSHDCSAYGESNLCVSFVGSLSKENDQNSSSGTLVSSFKVNDHFRVGAYIDQTGSNDFGGLATRQASPGVGLFGIWSQNPDESGIVVRMSAAQSSLDIETTRLAIGTAEAGVGTSKIDTKGAQLEISRAFAISDVSSIQPYIGYRRTTNERAGYTETNSVDAPLTYSSVKQRTETAYLGAELQHKLSESSAIAASAALERDIGSSFDDYSAENLDIGEIASVGMLSGADPMRVSVSFTYSHNFDNDQRVAFSVSHREGEYNSGAGLSGVIQYSIGF